MKDWASPLDGVKGFVVFSFWGWPGESDVFDVGTEAVVTEMA